MDIDSILTDKKIPPKYMKNCNKIVENLNFVKTFRAGGRPCFSS